MAHFKMVTLGHTVVMGRKTWESLPNRYLDHRRNVVVTSSPEGRRTREFCDIEAKTIEETESMMRSCALFGQTVFVIGGQSLFEKFKEKAEWIYRTQIYGDFKCDTFAPEIDERKYDLVVEKPFNSVTGFAGSFEVLRRKM
jgi:dihydrofolate reductase